ncbi:hypothetical protein ACFVTX_04975 [Agromyces sp. NPDC058136]|uniref:hypothetical protein n=1 Tax=Agromyces sp. NPDC058136 TaxID=3346354 RepID=UPI0036D949DB
MTVCPEAQPKGIQGLVTARALWAVRASAAQQAIDAATLALTEGVDSDPLRELAGANKDMNVFELGGLIDSALSTAGVNVGDMTEDDALMISARHYANCVLQGQMSVRELAAWAHSRLGHEGPEWAQELVELDDAFDALDGGWGREPDWEQILGRFLVSR